MKYLPDELRREYDFLVKNHPDIEGLEHPLINLSDTLQAYFILFHYFTDESSSDESESMLFGIRSIDLLASALGRQVVSFGGKIKYTNSLDICATLFYGLVKNHSFSDGNKRTALLVLLYQLHLYGYMPCVGWKEFERLVVNVAANGLHDNYKKNYKNRKFEKINDADVKEISLRLRKMVKKKDNTYHISPSMKEFCSALEKIGVSYSLENGKIKFTFSEERGKWKNYKPEENHFSIPFGGWTRTVGPKKARDVLKGLGLYDQFSSYGSIFEGTEPMYDLVDKFKEPLRRLKDK